MIAVIESRTARPAWCWL